MELIFYPYSMVTKSNALCLYENSCRLGLAICKDDGFALKHKEVNEIHFSLSKHNKACFTILEELFRVAGHINSHLQ